MQAMAGCVLSIVKENITALSEAEDKYRNSDVAVSFKLEKLTLESKHQSLLSMNIKAREVSFIHKIIGLFCSLKHEMNKSWYYVSLSQVIGQTLHHPHQLT